MNFITKYQKYYIIIIISLALGFIRWAFLDKEFPLIGLSENQNRAIKIRQLSEEINTDIIDFSLMKKIVSDKVFSIIDARDIDSYNEGFIGDAINIDALLLIEDGDENETNKLYQFFNSFSGNRIILYCWNPDCDRAEFLRAFLIDSDLMLESNISIYEGGWEEWDSLYKGK
tara:strand:+ start:148 stop:663 length:516 start_codon:yes stop_codon:yes gene_type:complete